MMNDREVTKYVTSADTGVSINLTEGHYFIGGKVGGGISAFSKNIICQNLITNAEIYGIDFNDVLPVMYGERLKGSANNKKQALSLLKEILRRKNTNTVIVIDETVELFTVLQSENRIEPVLRNIRKVVTKLFNTPDVRFVAFTRIPVLISEYRWFYDKISNRITLTTFKDSGIIVLGDNYLGIDFLKPTENYAYMINQSSTMPTKISYANIDDDVAKLIGSKTLNHRKG